MTSATQPTLVSPDLEAMTALHVPAVSDSQLLDYLLPRRGEKQTLLEILVQIQPE